MGIEGKMRECRYFAVITLLSSFGLNQVLANDTADGQPKNYEEISSEYHGISWKTEWPTERKNKCDFGLPKEEYLKCIIKVAEADLKTKEGNIIIEAKQHCLKNAKKSKCKFEISPPTCVIIQHSWPVARCSVVINFFYLMTIINESSRSNFKYITTEEEARALSRTPNKNISNKE